MVSSPEKSGRIVAHEKMQFSNGNYETRSSKVSDENVKGRVAFESRYRY